MARIYGTLEDTMTAICDRCKHREEAEHSDTLPIGWIQLKVSFIMEFARPEADQNFARDLCGPCSHIVHGHLLNMTRMVPNQEEMERQRASETRPTP